jgi:hypothetical protein
MVIIECCAADSKVSHSKNRGAPWWWLPFDPFFARSRTDPSSRTAGKIEQFESVVCEDII